MNNNYNIINLSISGLAACVLSTFGTLLIQGQLSVLIFICFYVGIFVATFDVITTYAQTKQIYQIITKYFGELFVGFFVGSLASFAIFDNFEVSLQILLVSYLCLIAHIMFKFFDE